MSRFNNDGSNGSNKRSRLAPVIGTGVVGIGVVVGLGFLLLCASGYYRNANTPAGYMGYVTEGSVLGKAQFTDVQTGPTSTGMRWLRDTINISVNPLTYTETFENNGKTQEAVQANDSTKIEFAVSIKWRVRPDAASVRKFVEKFTTLKPGDHADTVLQVAYENYLKQPFRTAARQEIERLAPFAIKEHMAGIGENLQTKMINLTKDTPFEVLSINFGFVHLPEEVTNQVAASIASNELLAQKDTEIKIEQAEADKRVIEAEGLAEAMSIIKRKLTGLYLQHEAIEVQVQTIQGPNHTTMIVPVGPLGVPVFKTPTPKTAEAPEQKK